MRKLFVFAVFGCVLLFPKQANAALYINEFSSKTSPDWVEIYNSGPDNVDLGDYTIKDASTNTKALGGALASGSFTTIDWDDNLNNGGDTIRLILDSDGSTVDEIIYGSNGTAAPNENQSAGRSPDGGANWALFSTPSKGSSNNSSTIVPTPTPTPTNSPTNTPTPTPTNSPTNTPTPSPTPSKAPTSTPKAGTPTVAMKAKTSGAPSPQTMTAMNTAANNHQVQGAQTSNQSNVELGGQLDALEAPKQPYNWWKLLIIMGTVIVTGACSLFMYNNYLKSRKEEEL